MKIAQRISEVRALVRDRRQEGRRIGFVPTMGYLHEGHLSLVRRARADCGTVVVSIFVNPLQFGPREDLAAYPRDLERDAALLRAEGVDLLFAPPEEEMYPQGQPLTFVEVHGLTAGLCGASRPGHFRGVATVVNKLFQIVQPDAAYFGQKDYQQLQVIRRMVLDTNLPVEIVGCPIVREPDGLAMSSRNVYLTPPERTAARVLSQALAAARGRAAAGERDAAALQAHVQAVIAAEPLARIDYVAIVDAESLQPVERLSGRVLVALAVYIGRTRLIDNTVLELPSVES